MKKLTTLKTLLVGLCAMGAMSAWAETATLLNNEGPWTHTHDGGSGARSAIYDFDVNSSIEDNWTVSFDVTTTTGSTWTQGSDFQIAVTKDGTSYTNNAVIGVANIIFGARIATTRSNMGSDLACTITLNGTDVEGATTLTHGIKYTFTISVNGTALTASIMNGNTAVYSGNATLGAFIKPRGIYDLLPRPYNASWGVYTDTYENIKLTKEVAAGSVEIPSASITAVDGINRTVTFTCPTENVSFSYSTNNGTSWTDGDYVVISENADIIVKATKGANSAQSDVLSFQAGTEITLNIPTWTKTGYTNGVSTVTLADNQSNILLNPATTIKYQINDGDVQAFSTAISINDGETLKYWSEATGYTNSEIGSVTAMTPCTYPTIFTETYNGSNAGISVNTQEVVTEIGGNSTPYYYMYANDAHVSDYLITSNTVASNWLLRSTGVYAGNTVNYALTNVQKNDIVTISIVWGTEKPVPSSGDGTLDQWNSIPGTTYVFKVTSTMGNFRFSLGRYASVKSVKVQRESESVKISNAGYSTYCSPCALDFSGVEGLTAYTASLNGSEVTFKEITEAIPANTGVLLKGTAGTTYKIPVASSYSDVTSALVGVNKETVVEVKGIFVLMNIDNVVGFYKTTAESFTVGAHTAYIPALEENPSRNFIAIDETTAIKAIETAKQISEIYNLAGQRVKSAQKGLYIIDGKKVVIK